MDPVPLDFPDQAPAPLAPEPEKPPKVTVVDPITWWDQHYQDFVSPPRHLPPDAADRRRDLLREWQYCDHGSRDSGRRVRREALLLTPAGRKAQPKLAARIEELEAARDRLRPPPEFQLAQLRDKIETKAGIRHWPERRKLQAELARLEALAVDVPAKIHALNRQIDQLIAKCPPDLENAYRLYLAEERRRLAEELLRQEEREQQEREARQAAKLAASPTITPSNQPGAVGPAMMR